MAAVRRPAHTARVRFPRRESSSHRDPQGGAGEPSAICHLPPLRLAATALGDSPAEATRGRRRRVGVTLGTGQHSKKVRRGGVEAGGRHRPDADRQQRGGDPQTSAGHSNEATASPQSGCFSSRKGPAAAVAATRPRRRCRSTVSAAWRHDVGRLRGAQNSREREAAGTREGAAADNPPAARAQKLLVLVSLRSSRSFASFT